MPRAVLTAAFRTIPVAPLRGSFFRAIPLQRSTTPLSAIGSLLFGGRFNPAGDFEAFYLAESPDTTLYEMRVVAAHAPPRRMKPTVTFTLDVDVQHAVDLTSPPIQTALGINTADLLLEWNAVVNAGGVPITHHIGHAARNANVEALRVPSARKSGDANLVILVDRLRPGSTIRIDPTVGFPVGTVTEIQGSHTPA